MRSNLIFLVCVILLASCNKKIEDICKSELNLKLNIGADIVINNDDIIYESINTYYKNFNDKKYLFRSFHRLEKIEILDWDNKTLEKNIILPHVGPNHISNVMAGSFYPITKDSIFLPSISNQVGIQYKDSLIYKQTFDYDHLLFFGSKNSQKIFQNNNNLILNTGNFFRLPAKDKLWNKYYPLKKINLEDNSLEFLDIQYPTYYQNLCWNWLQMKIIYSLFDNKIIYAFGASDEIHVFDLDKNKVVESHHCFKSKYQGRIDEPISCEATQGMDEQKTVKNRTINYAIEYDPYRDVFYAIKILPTSDDSRESLEPWWNLMVPFTIMAFDSEFKLIDEVLIPEKKFNINDFFVDEKGFWISKNNSLNPEASEDKLIYTLIELK